MRSKSEAARLGWETRRRRYGESGMRLPEFVDPIYAEHLYDRWLNVHDIKGIGRRAAEETA